MNPSIFQEAVIDSDLTVRQIAFYNADGRSSFSWITQLHGAKAPEVLTRF
jgi:hypothetical protein